MLYKNNSKSGDLGSPSINRPKAWHKGFGNVFWHFTTLTGDMIICLDDKNNIRKWLISSIAKILTGRNFNIVRDNILADYS